FGRLKELLALQGYLQVIGFYQDIIAPLTRIGEKSKNPAITMGYFSQVMETKGLSSIHEDVLREMGRTVLNILAEEPGQAKLILPEVFTVLERSFALYPDAVLY